ncbi:MAG: hypothetical protein ACQESG_03680 [Nanobdellota archaeon]
MLLTLMVIVVAAYSFFHERDEIKQLSEETTHLQVRKLNTSFGPIEGIYHTNKSWQAPILLKPDGASPEEFLYKRDIKVYDSCPRMIPKAVFDQLKNEDGKLILLVEQVNTGFLPRYSKEGMGKYRVIVMSRIEKETKADKMGDTKMPEYDSTVSGEILYDGGFGETWDTPSILSFVFKNMADTCDLDERCPPNYVAVPGNFDVDGDGINESGFCVMKYEAKRSKEDLPVSHPSGRPWVNISQIEARAKCKALGEGYSLITNTQWIQIAKIAIGVGENWIKRRYRGNALIRGHSDQVPFHPLEASPDDSKAYYRTYNKGDEQRRTVYIMDTIKGDDPCLVNNYTGIIWDFAGNIWEWNNDSFICEEASCPNGPQPSDSRNHELPELTSPGRYLGTFELLRPNSEWDSDQNVGRIFTVRGEAIPDGKEHAFIRGGIWYDEKDAGLFTLHLAQAPSYSSERISFRCVYEPPLPDK